MMADDDNDNDNDDDNDDDVANYYMKMLVLLNVHSKKASIANKNDTNFLG